jgi:hypothetical protein
MASIQVRKPTWKACEAVGAALFRRDARGGVVEQHPRALGLLRQTLALVIEVGTALIGRGALEGSAASPCDDAAGLAAAADPARAFLELRYRETRAAAPRSSAR